MQILKRGCEHKGYVWHDTCEICGSYLRMIEDKRDPAIKSFGDCGAYFKRITYTCPVCNNEQTAYAANSGRIEDINNDRARARTKACYTKREYQTLTQEDLKELKGYEEAAKKESGD